MNHDIPAAAAWSAPVRAGRSMTLTALADGANASVLIIGSDRLDRLNIPDWLGCQHFDATPWQDAALPPVYFALPGRTL